MAIFIGMAKIAFSPLSEPKDEDTIRLNCYKTTSRGAWVSGGTALASFIFNRFLAQEGACKAVAPYVFSASLYSFFTFTFFAFCINRIITQVVRSIVTNPAYDKKCNDAMSRFAKKTALVGMIGAAAGFAFKFVAPNSVISSRGDRLFSPLLGLGTAGSVLWIYLNSQKKQLEASNEKTYIS